MGSPEKKFAKLVLDGWRQFDSVEIDFGEQLTVLTGANGAGKTTILSILARFFGWNLQFVATRQAWSGRLRKQIREMWRERPPRSQAIPGNAGAIGQLTFSDGTSSELYVGPGDVAAYAVGFTWHQVLPGIYISSYRPEYFYAPLSEIPTALTPKSQLLEQYVTLLRQRYATNAKVQPPLVQLKMTCSPKTDPSAVRVVTGL